MQLYNTATNRVLASDPSLLRRTLFMRAGITQKILALILPPKLKEKQRSAAWITTY